LNLPIVSKVMDSEDLPFFLVKESPWYLTPPQLSLVKPIWQSNYGTVPPDAYYPKVAHKSKSNG